MEILNHICIPGAYIGPGAGLGLIVSLLGLAAAVTGAIITCVAWPIRKMLKRRRQAKLGQ